LRPNVFVIGAPLWPKTMKAPRGGVHTDNAHYAPRVAPSRRSTRAPVSSLPGDRGAFIFRECGQNSDTGEIFAMIGRLSKHEKPEVENSDMAQECLDNAAHWERRAASAIDDPAAKAMFEQLAHIWYQLARCWREARIARLNCGTMHRVRASQRNKRGTSS